MYNRERRGIVVNQTGYITNGKKKAVFLRGPGTFQVIDKESGSAVYEGTTMEGVDDEASGMTVYQGDFSKVTVPGTYELIMDDDCSAPFLIGDNPYNALHHSALKAYYFFRCGMKLEEKFAGPYIHEACHLSEGVVYDDPTRQIDGGGGWHDAGDYGKYTVAAAKAVADLLLAFEIYPRVFQEPTPIPESDGKVPDILHECRYELEWLLKMQEGSGGVFHKLTTLHFPGLDVMPEDDLEPLYFSPVSATATASFAAVMAMAGRLYKKYDAEFSEVCVSKAVKAWNWLVQHPDLPGFINPPDVFTGEYGDEDDRDERYWAAAELYRTTEDAKFHEAFESLAQHEFSKISFGWADVGGYGTISYLLNEKSNRNPALFEKLKELFISHAYELVERSEQDCYSVSITPDEYIWGSNMLVMNNAMHLLLANYLLEDPALKDCAAEQLHYILGKNAMDICYVTGFGERPIMDHHHRPSVADGVAAPIPGLLSGGPNKGLQDECAKKYLSGKPPAQCFIDNKDSYSTNEVTIYWNSPLVFVLSHWVN